MIEIILCSVITAFVCCGLQIATGEKMILHFIKVKLDKLFIHGKRIDKIYYPILYCIRCMPSVYGSIFCLVFLPHTIHLLYLIPIVILCSSTLATIIHSLYL